MGDGDSLVAVVGVRRGVGGGDVGGGERGAQGEGSQRCGAQFVGEGEG